MHVHYVYSVLVGGVCVYIGSGMSCSLEHEEQVSVFLSSATIKVAKVGGIGDMVDNETQPQQTAQDY